MYLALLFCGTLAFPERIEDIANKRIQIVFPTYSEYFLAQDMANFSDRPFGVATMDMGSSFNTFSKINRDGGQFEIRVGEEKMCERNGKVSTCLGKVDLWDIVAVRYGFNIRKDGRCVTAGDGGLVLEECRMSKRQLVDFLVVPGIFQCIERAGNLLGPPATDEEKRIRRLLGKKLAQAGKKRLQDLRKALHRPRTFDEFMNKKLPGLRGKKKMMDLFKKLWNKTHRWKLSGVNLRAWLNFFCPL